MFSVGKKFKLFLTSLDLKQGKVGFVWGQHESRFDDYAALEKLLNGSNVNSNTVGDGVFNIGDIVIAKYEDGSWYRSQILEEAPNNKYKVCFMDFGNEEFVVKSDVHVGQPNLFDLPPLASKFLLGDICGGNNLDWSADEKSALEMELLNMEFSAEVLGSDAAGLLPTVRLCDESGDLVSKKLLSQGTGTSYDNGHLKMMHIQPCKLTVGKVYPVYVSFSVSAMRFWVQLISNAKHVEQMETKLIEYIENGLHKLKAEELVQGMSCVAKYVEANSYYRASITGVHHSEQNCTVHFVDYGNTEKVAFNDLYMLPREEATMHGLCVECSLTGKAVRTTDFDALIESEDVMANVLHFTGNSYIVELQRGSIGASNTPQVTQSSSQVRMASSSIPYVPIELDRSTLQDVCVSHVERDGTFYLQLLQYASVLEDLMSQLGDKSSSPLLGTVSNGKPCVARDTQDMISYRGEVMANDVATIRVKLVDFGNVESFSVSDLCGIDPVCMKLPTQARACILQGANPQNCRQIFELLKPYESCKVLACSVVGKDDSGLLKVDLYDPSKHGAKLIDLLGVSVVSETGSSTPQMITSSNLNPSSCAYLPAAEVKTNTVERLYVMAILSDTEIYCQLSKYSQEKLENFQSQLQEFYSSHEVKSLRSPKQGDICCSQFTEDKQFYRSKVLQVSSGNTMATIRFVDYGNQETVQVSALKELAPQFFNLPVQGVACCFDETYSGLNMEVLASLADHELVANVVKKEGSTICINLTDSKDNADAIGVLKRYMKPGGAGRPKQQSSGGYEKQFFMKGMWDECFVTFADDPQSFYMQLTSHADELNNLMEKLETYCASVEASGAQPSVTDLSLPVAAKYSEDGQWYRAVITGILKNGNVEVFFVDYGNADTIPRSDLRPLTPELMKTPVQAIKCTLNRIKPGSSALWNPQDVEEFNSLVFDSSGSVIFKVQIGTYIESEDKYYVELFRKDVNVNETFLSARGYLKMTEGGPGTPPNTLPFIPGEQTASAPTSDTQNSGWASGFIKTSQKQETSSKSDNPWTEQAASTGNSFGNPQKRGFGSGDQGSDFGSDGSGSFRSKSDRFEQKNSGGFGSGFNEGGGGGFGKSRGGFSDGAGSEGGSSNKGGCFKCGEDGHISRNCPNADSRPGAGRGGGGGSGWNREEMLATEVNKADVGKIIGKGGSRIKEIQETSGARVRVLSKDAPGDIIPVEIYGTEEQRASAKEIIDQIVNATFGGGQSGGRRGPENRGFGGESSGNSWDTGGQRSGDGFGGRSGGFNDSGSRSGGFGGDQQGNTKTDDWGDSGSSAFKSVPDRNSFGGGGSFSQSQGSSLNRRDDSRDHLSNNRVVRSQSSGLRYKVTDLPLNQYKELVATHHESPSLFYFQLQETYGKLETLMEKLQVFYGSLDVPDMALMNVIKDRVCVAKYSEDGKWYRAKVVSAKGGMIRVFFVDYGNEEDVGPSCVKELKEEFLYLPTQAVVGRLFGVQPKSGKWSLEAINRFIDLTTDVVIGTAVETRDDETVVMELASENHPIHEVLIKEGLAAEEHDDIPLPKAASRRKLSTSSASSTASSRAGDLRLRDVTLPCGQKVEFYISYASSPAKFWVNLTSNAADMDDLMSRIAEQYDSLAPGDLMFASPEAGNLCCARYEKDKAWYRGKIKEVKTDRVLVDFVDYGNEEWMKHENIRQIVRSFTQLPAQAVCCILDGAVPVGGKWTNEGIVKFEDLTEGDNLMAQVNSREAPHYVSITQKDTGISVAEELVNAGFARQGRPTEQASKFSPRIMNSGDRVNVVISWVISHKEFYCQVAPEGDQLLSLQEKLSQHYEGCRLKDEMLQNPQVGDLCVAYFEEDGNWYRGVVVKVDKAQTAGVKYIDYGNFDNVQKTKLKAIKQEFESVPTFAMKCALKDPTGGAEIDWNQKAMQLFRKLTQEQLILCIESVVKDVHTVDMLDSSGRSIIEALLGREQISTQNQARFESNRFENKSRGEPFGGQNSDQGGRNFARDNDRMSNDRFGSQSNTFGQNKAFGSGDNRKDGFAGREDRNRGFNDRKQDSWDTEPSGGSFEGKNRENATINTAPVIEKPAQKPASISTSQKKLSLPDQPVVKGKQEVYISHVTSVGDFCIQLLSKENEILEKTDQLTAEYEALGASDRKDIVAAPGQLCCAKFEDDEAWYRARIASVSGDQATVTFIDYGNSATMASSSLRSLVAEHCKNPALAYNCKLNKFNVHNERDTEKLQEFSEDGVKVLLLEFVSSNKPPYRVVLYNPASPEVSLATQLPSYISQPEENPVSLPKPVIPSGEVTGYVSHINSPSSFTIQLQSQEDALANVSNLLDGYSTASDPLDNVSIGAPCVAQFSEDEAWYRSIVVSLDDGDKATVEFVDYGNRDTVERANLKELTDTLLKDPPFAIHCSLDGISGNSFSDEMIEAFSAYTVDKVSKIRIASQEEPCLVTIHEEEVCVNDKIKELLTGAENLPLVTEPSTDEPVAKYAAQPPLSGRYQAFIHHIENPGEFYFQLLRDEHDKNELYDELDKIYEESSVEILTSPQVGGACCVKDSVNHTWNRSQIVTVADQVEVQFIDFGNCETVSKEELRILRPRFLEVHALSYRAKLNGVLSNTDKEWPQEVSDKLYEETVEKVITVDIKSKGLPYETILQYNNLNINELVLQDLPNEFLCEEDGEDTGSEQYESAVDEVADELGDSQGDDTTITPADDTTNISMAVSATSHHQVPQESDASLYSDLQDTFDEGGSIDRSTTPVPGPLTQFGAGDKFEAYMSHHVSPSQFWVHLESQEGGLETFSDALQAHYSSEEGGESVKAEDVYTGKMCVAKYTDDLWYRAVVRSVTETGVEVLFIDFGNTENVALSELRDVSENFRSPLPFAIACVLYGIRAKDGEWDESSLETFESLSAEQKLTVEVKLVNCDEGESLYVVKLHDSSGKSLAHAMLEQDMAEDVTSPLVRSRKNSREALEDVTQRDLPKFTDSLLEEPETEMARQVDTIDTGARHFSVDEVQDTPKEGIDIKETISTEIAEEEDIEDEVDGGEKPEVTEESEVDVVQQSGNTEMAPCEQDIEEDNGDDIQNEANVESESKASDGQLMQNGVDDEDRMSGYKDAELSKHTVEQIEEIMMESEDAELIGEEIEAKDNTEDLVGENEDKDNAESSDTEEEGEEEEEEEGESSAESSIELKADVSKPIVLSTIVSEEHLKLGCKVEGQVVYVQSPHRLWIQLKDFAQRFGNLVTEMQEYYSELVSVESAFQGDVVVGLSCVAYSKDDESYHRAVIKSVTEDSTEVTLHYVDYGNEENVPAQTLKKLEQNFGTLPSQAVEVCLCDIEPYDGTEWDLEATDLLSEITMDKQLLIEVKGIQGESYQVSLLDMGMPVSNRLVAKNLARRTGANPDLTVDESRLDLTTVVEIERTEVGIEGEDEQEQSNEEEVMLKEGESEGVPSERRTKEMTRFHQPTLVTGSTVDVYIPHVDTPHCFYCQLVTSSAELPLFTDKLVDFYSSLKEGEGLVRDLSVGQACVAQFSENLSWYRAVVTAIAEDGVHVFFVDYGNSEVVATANIRAIQQEFLDFPVQVFRCGFSSLRPASGADWEEDSCSRLQEICSGLDTYDNKVFKVELKRVKYTESGAIELVEVNVWDGDVNIPEQLVEGGYARVEEQPVYSRLEEGEDPDINQFAADIVSSTIEMGKQKFLKQTKDKTQVEIVITSPDEEVSAYKLLDLQAGCEVEVKFLSADSPHLLCLLLADQSSKELEEILHEYDSDITESETHTREFEAEEACMCRDIDQWKRGSIISVQGGEYEVMLVDENTTAVFPKDRVSATRSELVEIPVLAIQCKLAGIVPMTENDDWSKEACDEMQVLCQDKELTAQIVETSEQVYSIYLHNYKEDSSLSVNHQLVRKGLAKFQEGYAMDLQYELNSKMENSFNDISLCMSNSLGSLDESAVIESCDDDAFRHLVYHVGQTVESVFVNCNENHLVCQPLDTQKELQNMNQALNRCYDEDSQPTLQSPQTGQPCCVKSAVDDSWHRAVIQDIKSSPVPIAKCYAVDTGDCIASSLDKVKLLQQKFFALPSQAITVKLTGLEDLCGKSTEVYNFLESNYEEEDGKVHLLLQVDRVNSEHDVKATVFMNSGNTIKDELLENEILNPQQQAASSVNTSSDYTDDSDARPDLCTVRSLPDAGLSKGVPQAVVISHAESPASFWCQLTPQPDHVQALLEDYDNKLTGEQTTSLEEGDFCIAYSSDKKCWRRAKIQSEYGGLYSVQFVDQGVCDTTEKVLPMTAHLAEIPVQAVHCMLPHLQPRGTEWSEEVEALFGSYIEEKKQFDLHIESMEDSSPACVKLVMDDGEASLADILLEQKLARTDLSTTKLNTEEHDRTEDGE